MMITTPSISSSDHPSLACQAGSSGTLENSDDIPNISSSDDTDYRSVSLASLAGPMPIRPSRAPPPLGEGVGGLVLSCIKGSGWFWVGLGSLPRTSKTRPKLT